MSKLNIFSEGSSGFLGKMDHKVQVIGPSGKPEPQAAQEPVKSPVSSSGLDHLARLGLVSAPQAQGSPLPMSSPQSAGGPHQVRKKGFFFHTATLVRIYTHDAFSRLVHNSSVSCLGDHGVDETSRVSCSGSGPCGELVL